MTTPTSPSLPLHVTLQQAVAHHQAGRLPEAEALYRAILQAQPHHAEANHNLGTLFGQVGQYVVSLPYLKAALGANPAQEQYWRSYAEALLACGQAKAAQTLLQKAIQHGFKTPAVQALRQKAKAVAQNKPVKGAAPSSEEMSQLVALFNAGHYENMENQARLLVKQYPNSGFVWKALGLSLQRQGQDALPALQKAIQFLPDDAEAHNNLGAALSGIRQFDNGLASYRRALKIKPNYAEAHSNLGNLLRELGQFDNALVSYRRALKIKPDYAEAHNNLGLALYFLGQTEKAQASYRRALEIDPYLTGAYSNLGTLLQSLGQFDEAVISFRRALAIDPDYAEAHSNLLFCLSHHEAVDAPALFAEHTRFTDQFEAPWRTRWPQHRNVRAPERRLQVGFVSADLRNHAVANFIEPVLACLATYPQLSLHAYYNHPIEDAVSLRLRSHFAHWQAVAALSDDALVQKIIDDGIDILIDLSGHTAHHRLLAFARKPAPIQATWMGYPGTTGLQAMDYYLADHHALPPGQFDAQFTEKLAYLPAGAPFLPFQESPSVQPLPALSNGYLTLGSFNRLNKLSPSVIALWSQLLRALPDAKMLIGSMPPDGQSHLLIEWFAEEGIARERLNFIPRSEMPAYLALHHQVDLCLDTFPYNGGTTTLHALSMGVPTLTLAGRTVAGRTGAAILGHVGLESFVASSAEDFVAKGVYWAGQLAPLAEIRSTLRERFAQSAMGQPARVAAGLERALRLMWQRWCAGLPAESFEASLPDIKNPIVRDAGQ